jgi:hypothetical protein
VNTSRAPSTPSPVPSRSKVNRSDLVRYLSDTNTRVLTYHNHKEVAAWAAVAVLFTYSAVIVQCVDKGIGSKIGLSFVTLLVGSFVFWYVHEELMLRREMSILTFVLPRLAFRLLEMPDDEFDALDWRMGDINENTYVISASLAAPAFVLEDSQQISRLMNPSRRILELLTRGLIALTIAALIWIIVNSGKVH